MPIRKPETFIKSAFATLRTFNESAPHKDEIIHTKTIHTKVIPLQLPRRKIHPNPDASSQLQAPKMAHLGILFLLPAAVAMPKPRISPTGRGSTENRIHIMVYRLLVPVHSYPRRGWRLRHLNRIQSIPFFAARKGRKCSKRITLCA